MHVTVAGRVPPDQLFEALDRLETKVVEKRASGELTNEPWTERPFQVLTKIAITITYFDSVKQ